MISVQQYNEIRKRLFEMDETIDAVTAKMGLSRSTVIKISTGVHSYDKKKEEEKTPQVAEVRSIEVCEIDPLQPSSQFDTFAKGFPATIVVRPDATDKLERCPFCGHQVVIPCFQCYLDWENGLLSPEPLVSSPFSKDLNPCPIQMKQEATVLLETQSNPLPSAVPQVDAPVSPITSSKVQPTGSVAKSIPGRKKKGGGNISKKSRRRQRSSKR